MFASTWRFSRRMGRSSPAAYLHNVIPSKNDIAKTPMKLWSGQKLLVKYLKTLACFAYYKDNAKFWKTQPKSEMRICETVNVKFDKRNKEE